jgi:glycine cleavage system transcriptional repressor
MKNFLAVSVLGSDHPGFVHELTSLATESACNIDDSRMTTLGHEFAIIMLLSGNWDAIAKFEHQIKKLEQKHELFIHLKRTTKVSNKRNFVRYNVNVISLDNPGLISKISQFFHERGLNILDLYTGTYAASYTGATMFSLNMTLLLPGDLAIADLREQFMLFCDDLNLDAIMEPDKN